MYSEQEVLRLIRDRIEGDRTRQIVEREIEPGTRANELLDLGIRLGACEIRVELHEHDLRHGEPCSPRELPHDDFRDQHFGTLTGTAKLEHVHAGIIGFDDGRQRAALTQGRDIAGCVDGAEFHCAIARLTSCHGANPCRSRARFICRPSGSDA